MKFGYYYDTSLGRVGIVENGLQGTSRAVCNLYWSRIRLSQIEYTIRETIILRRAGNQLKEYALRARKQFDLPLFLEGTDFEKKVWEAIQTIPYGQTRSFGEIAHLIGNDKAYRAVGRACRRNPIGIIVPCHRVTGSSGRLLGNAGDMDRKRRLLDIEGVELAE